jgi:hypothetical protein
MKGYFTTLFGILILLYTIIYILTSTCICCWGSCLPEPFPTKLEIKSVVEEAYMAPTSQFCKKNIEFKATEQICKKTIKYWTSIEHVEFKATHPELKLEGDCVTTKNNQDIKNVEVCAKYDPYNDKIIIIFNESD